MGQAKSGIRQNVALSSLQNEDFLTSPMTSFHLEVKSKVVPVLN
jgi:hypothetical protein